jgi:hypothetical protein
VAPSWLHLWWFVSNVSAAKACIEAEDIARELSMSSKTLSDASDIQFPA